MSSQRIDRGLMQAEALHRAESGPSVANFAAIFEGFQAKGIPMDEISPRENVFTYNAWLAKNRQVRKGEKGVKIVTWIPISAKTGTGSESTAAAKKSRGMFPRSATVFHISQTDPVAE